MGAIKLTLLLMVIIIFFLPFIMVPISLIYNWNLNRLQNKVREEISDRNAIAFAKWFRFGPLFKTASIWDRLIETYNIINSNKDISKETKDILYDIYVGRKFNPERLKNKINNKSTKSR